MPSKSAKQARTMAAAAHSPEFAAKVGIPQKVAKEFNRADEGTGIIKPKRGGKSGGTTKTTDFKGRFAASKPKGGRFGYRPID
jgi:hypothetical protein